MTPLIYVGGSKGGVGKSLVSLGLVDWLRTARNENVILVEGDGDNSEVYLACEKIVPVQAFDLDKSEGWDALGDLAEQTDGATIVVNSGARMTDAVNANGLVLEELAKAGVIDLTTVWPINRSKDSILALKRYRTSITSGRLAVIRNLFFGDEHKFTRWADSKFAKALASEGNMKVGNLPELTDRVIDIVYDDRMPIELIRNEAASVDKIRIDQWRRETHTMFAAVLA